ncbi:MAG: PadR family transcriptional regulator [Ktedonobacteraceae bacterium]
MFGKRFAYEFEGGEQGWTPPWLRDERHGPRHFGPGFARGQFGHGRPFGPQQEGWVPPWAREEFRGPHFFGMRRGRGPFGPGGPGGPHFGPGGDGPRFFGRGDMKFALLALLQERPMHGYEMIKALEAKSGGFYTPSPGSIYPTLQLLEDRSLVTVNEVEGKKVYSITDAGRTLLAEREGQHQHQHGPEFGPPWMRHRGPGGNRFSPELQALRSEAMEVMRLLTIAGRMSFQDPGQLAKLRTIIEHTRNDLADMIYGTQAGTNQAPTATPPQQDGPTVENV